MRSSTSLVLAVGAALVVSLGLKVALAPPAGHDASAPAARGETLRRFLAARAGPLEPVAGGWRFSRDGCRLMAFPSGPRGTMDMTALGHAHRRDRVAYVYRGRVSDQPPTLALALDVIAYKAVAPFRGGEEPGYVVLVASGCPKLPDLPWRELG